MMRRRNDGPFLLNKNGGGFVINLPPDVQSLLVHMFGELRDVLAQGSSSDPALRRLFPVAYHLDVESDEEYQRLMQGELIASRLAAISRATEILETDGLLTAGDMSQFMQSLNAIRLLLGTMLDVGEDHEPEDLPEDHPSAAQHHLYAYLGWLVESAVVVQQGRGGKLRDP